MQVRFSTDDLPPRDRVRFWCDYFAKQARSITPSEIPDPGAFRAEAIGSVAGGFALLDIKSGLERVQRTAADVAKDKTDAVFIRRSHRPAIWRVAPGSMPVDLIHEPGDFCVSSTEWRFDAESKGPDSFDMLVIPQAALSPLLAGGRLARPFRLPGASPLGSLLGAALDAARHRRRSLPTSSAQPCCAISAALWRWRVAPPTRAPSRGGIRCGRRSSRRSSATLICISPIPT
jgi:hypothetical protein